MSIVLTEKAKTEIKRIISSNDEFGDTTIVRFQVKGGGCSGFNYHLDFQDDATIDKSDRVTDQDGIKLVVDMKSALYLNGMEVDFTETYMARQFVFNNPNAKSTCGCGTSFAV